MTKRLSRSVCCRRLRAGSIPRQGGHQSLRSVIITTGWRIRRKDASLPSNSRNVSRLSTSRIRNRRDFIRRESGAIVVITGVSGGGVASADRGAGEDEPLISLRAEDDFSLFPQPLWKRSSPSKRVGKAPVLIILLCVIIPDNPKRTLPKWVYQAIIGRRFEMGNDPKFWDYIL